MALNRQHTASEEEMQQSMINLQNGFLAGLSRSFLSFLDSFLPFFVGGEADFREAPPDPEL
jgi:hypothetical protein